MKFVRATGSRTFHMIAAATIALLASPAHSQAVDTSEWICEFCPFESGHRAEVEIGAGNVSEESAYFGDASGYDDDGIYANVEGTGGYATDKHQLRWTLEDLGLDSRYAELEGGQPGMFDYSVSYRELPRRQFFTSNTIFQDSAANSLALPSGWVRGPTTASFSELDSSLVRKDIESDRKTLEIGASYVPTERVRLSANYKRQDHDGVDIYGGSFFTQSSLLPGRFDYVTDEVDLGVSYAADNGFLSLAWYLSDFENGNDSLTWENPFTSFPGADFGALAEAPDNTFQQISLAGSYRFAPYQTIVTISAATGRLDQNQPFQPYTINPSLTADPLPRSSLDAEIDTTNFAFALTSRPIEKSRVRLSYRYDDRDNQTTQDLWNRVIVDSFLSNDMEVNTPYSFERSTLNLSADYDLFDTVRVSGGYDRKTMDRDFQEVAEQTEDGGWGRVRWRPWQFLEIDVRGGAAKRDIDRYDETFAASLGQNPLLRKYNLAYRYREFGEMTLVASLPDSPVTLTINGLYADDSYTKSQMGITDADDLQLTADLSWPLSEYVSVYVNGGYENIESRQVGSEQSGLPDWRANNNDEFYTVGVGFRIGQISDKYDLQMDYTRSDGTSEINVTSNSGGASQFPDLESTLDFLRIQLSYQHSARLQVNANLRYQSFTAEDWALQDVEPATIPSVLTLGADPYDDELVLFGLGFRYLIGDQ